jgi:hypothetical protein
MARHSGTFAKVPEWPNIRMADMRVRNWRNI